MKHRLEIMGLALVDAYANNTTVCNFLDKKSLENRLKSSTTTFARKYAIFREFYAII